MTQERAFGLSSITLEKLNSVFAQHAAIDSVLIYGSRAKGNYRAGSDIDLTIKGSEISCCLIPWIYRNTANLKMST
ncbi:MAG: nucleotidyltransferase domain-containing protein [Nitrosomonas sp.]|nr:nucleotidyltransferase domain-containing protein [Nitrosomonas sp.]